MKTILSVTSKNETEEMIKYLKGQNILGNKIIITPEGSGEFVAFWRMTYRCNTSCRYCKENETSNSQEMSLSKRLETIKKIAGLTDELHLSGGEVTTVHGYEDIIRTAHLLGIRAGINTNGVLVDKLLGTSKFLDEMIVSLDYPPYYHNSNRIPTSYNQIFRNIRLLSRRHPKVIVETVVSDENYSDHFSNPEKNQFAEELLGECEISGVYYSFLMNRGRAKEFYGRSKVPVAKVHEAADLCEVYSKKYGINFSAYDGTKPFDPMLHINPFGGMSFLGSDLGNILDGTSDSILSEMCGLLEKLYNADVRVIESP